MLFLPLLVVPTVMVEEPDALIEAGLNVAVAPFGSPLTLNATVPENPPDGATLTLYEVLLPCRTVRVGGLAEKEKSGVATTRVALAVCV